jgi:hypothetical protein
MAAQIYSAPREIKAPKLLINGEYDPKRYEKDCETYINAVVEHCKTSGFGDLRGKEIRFAVADGYASYLVFSLRPLKLIHLALGDSYQFPYAHLLTAAQVRKEVHAVEAAHRIFGKKG